MLPDIWILTPAPSHRVEDVRFCHDYSGIDPLFRVVVTNPPNSIEPYELPGHLVNTGSEELNISKWWNAGIRYIREQYEDPMSANFHIFLAESDIRISNEDINKLSAALSFFEAGVAGANWHGLPLADDEYILSYENKHWGSDEKWRFPGVGFMVDGRLMLDFDEEMRWYFADCDMLFQHRSVSGSVLVGGTAMAHSGGTPMDALRVRYAEEDKVKFMNKWNLKSY